MHTRENKTGGGGLTTGDSLLGLPTFIHHMPNNPTSAATLQYILFSRLWPAYRNARPGWSEKQYSPAL